MGVLLGVLLLVGSPAMAQDDDLDLDDPPADVEPEPEVAPEPVVEPERVSVNREADRVAVRVAFVITERKPEREPGCIAAHGRTRAGSTW